MGSTTSHIKWTEGLNGYGDIVHVCYLGNYFCSIYPINDKWGLRIASLKSHINFYLHKESSSLEDMKKKAVIGLFMAIATDIIGIKRAETEFI
jgi:hypothetical protein